LSALLSVTVRINPFYRCRWKSSVLFDMTVNHLICIRYQFMSDVRLNRGKGRLIQHEQIIVKERTVIKRLGRILPDERVQIPKIGEWDLGALPESPTADRPCTAMRSAQGSRLKARSAVRSELSNRANPDPPPAPFTLHIPRIFAPEADPLDSLTEHPAGTVSTQLDEIIHSRYRSPLKPLPPLKAPEESEECGSTFLPLELFDDANLEQYSLDQLLKETRGFSRFNGSDPDDRWQPCKILHCDPTARIFLIEWEATGLRKKVPRFNLRFEKEDPIRFQERIRTAKQRCSLQESLLRFESRVAQMPTGNLPKLAPEDIVTIHSQIGIPVPQSMIPVLCELDAEVEEAFKLHNNRLKFIHDLEHNPMIPNRDAFFELLKA
jgi:hypothetical protein